MFAAGDVTGPLRENGIATLALRNGNQLGVLGDGFVVPAFAMAMLELIRKNGRLHNSGGEITASHAAGLRDSLADEAMPHSHGAEHWQKATLSLCSGDKLVLKFFRRLNPGVNTELEVSRWLTGQNFPNSPAWLGAMTYDSPGRGIMTLGVLKAFAPNIQNGLDFTLEAIGRYYERVVAESAQGRTPPESPADLTELVGTYIESARLLGVRTAELHLALAAGQPGDEFSVEPMTAQYLRGLFQSMRSTAVQNLRLLRKRLKAIPPDLEAVAQHVLDFEQPIVGYYRELVTSRIAAGRIRTHGDLHLDQVLWTGRDFMFLDFEGDSAQPISERCIKRSPLRDVARMLRSFHHAMYAGFYQQTERGVIPHENLSKLEPWLRQWNRLISREYLQAYCAKLQPSGILPADDEKLRRLLLAFLLDQVMDELGNELQAGSANVRAPLQAIMHLADDVMALKVPDKSAPKSTT